MEKFKVPKDCIKTIQGLFDIEVMEFDTIIEAKSIQALKENRDKVIYTRYTEGVMNWISEGIGYINAMSYMLLPSGLPERIDLADDDPPSVMEWDRPNFTFRVEEEDEGMLISLIPHGETEPMETQIIYDNGDISGEGSNYNA